MTDSLEYAKEGLEHAGHSAHGDGTARRVAVLVAVLAAGLAIGEMAEKGAQNGYLTHHIQATDDWAFYQAKTTRANLYTTQAETLTALAAGRDAVGAAALDKQATAARATAARLLDDPKGREGRAQLAKKAKASEVRRDVAFHRYHLFEGAVGALQIAIVLASVSVVTRVRTLALAAGALGVAAGVLGGLVAAGLI